MTQCNLCYESVKTWTGSDPVCAFGDSEFCDNWNCATVGRIRQIIWEGNYPQDKRVDYRYCEDQKYVTLYIDDLELPDRPMCLWITWYKSRGTTDQMYLLFSDQPPRTPTENELLEIADKINGE